MIIATVSFWDEHPADLGRMVASLGGLCDRAVFMDGRYALFPGDETCSAVEQYATILGECNAQGIECIVSQPTGPFEGNEVQKRAALFELAKTGTTSEDWFFRIDADEAVTYHADIADALSSTDLDVAKVTATGISPGGADRAAGRERTLPHRMLFRALPGLTVTGAHWHYVDGERVLWGPNDRMVPALDLTSNLVVTHHARTDLTRTDKAWRYYEARSAHAIEL